MKKEKGTLSLGESSINKLMLKFSIPCILSLLVSSFYNIVDQIFIGNSELSTLGNAATGVVFPVFIIAQAFAWCFGDGCAAFLNICQGRKDDENAHRAIGSSLTVAFLSGLLIMGVVYPFKTEILTVFGASENTMAYAVEYLDIILATMPIFILCNMMNSIIRADGSPSWAMASMLAGAITNIILDPVFIFGFKWGMSGAALATVIGQLASFVMSLSYFFRTKTFKLTKESFIPNAKALGSVVGLGFSTFVTQLAIVIVAILSNIQLAKFGALSEYGADIPIAIIGIQSKVFSVVINLVVGIVLGCQPIISYNMGARKYDRLMELYRKITTCTLIIGLAFTALFQLAPDFVVGLFGEPSNIPNPEAYWVFGEKTMRIFLSLVSVSCLIKMHSIFFQAVGKPIHAAVSSMVRDVLCFVPLILIIPSLDPNVETMLYAAPISDLIALVVIVTLAILFIKSLRRADKAEEEEVEAVLKSSHPGPIITISREHGSGGKQIGKRVSEILEIPFYYKEMTALAAKECGFDKEFLSGIDESSASAIYNLYLSTDAVRDAILAQDKVIKRIAEEGSCVIVGRAADHVLSGRPDVVRIFITAPIEYRTSRVMEIYGDAREEAHRHIKRSDEARASYYKQITGRAWGCRSGYDLVLNSEMGVEESARAIISFVRSKFEENN